MASEIASERRRRVSHRALPVLGAMALVSLAAGAIVGSVTDSESERIAADFARAWERQDFAAMHRLLGPAARERYPRRSFEAAYANAAETATAVAVRTRPPRERGGSAVVPVAVRTRIFGTVRGEVALAVTEDAVDWKPHMAFPGLEEGVTLARRTEAPPRAAIRSVDGKTLVEGPAGMRSSPLGATGSSIAGTLEEAEAADRRKALFALGFPSDTPVGASGLERVFERRLRGTPGGTLRAGPRELARSRPRRARPVRTSIDSRLQEAAVTALAGRFGGIAALDTRSGAIRALAGIAFSAPQPPGSTFKIVTTVAALEDRKVRPQDEFPVESKAIIDGVELENANGELCGGTFSNSFAHSCNSVFAPLGVKVGSKRLVEVAERFGWNGPPTVRGEKPSTLPEARKIVSPLEVGSTAIGQFKVLATPLQLASVAQTIASGGVRRRPTLAAGSRSEPERVTSKRVASTVEELMIGVVGFGTGTAAAIPGVKVAGKTGTAELEDTRGTDGEQDAASDPMNTDAWFTAYAPADRPELAVAVLLVRNGSGGATAAPAARIVLARALGKG